MATLYITECKSLGYATLAGQLVQAPVMPPITEKTLTVTSSSTASTTFSATTQFVMVHTDATCSLAWSAISTTATATTSAQRMGAGETRFYCVNAGGSVSVVANS